MNSIHKISFSLAAALLAVSASLAQPAPPGKKQAEITPQETPQQQTLSTMADPRGKLIYCSYSKSSPAGGGKDYCELINENGKVEVVVCLNSDCRFAEEVKQTFTASEEDVKKMKALLKDLKVWQLNGLESGEEAPGATRYRIYQEYESGEHPYSIWYSTAGTAQQRAAYNAIKAFFSKWVTQLPTPSPLQ